MFFRGSTWCRGWADERWARCYRPPRVVALPILFGLQIWLCRRAKRRSGLRQACPTVQEVWVHVKTGSPPHTGLEFAGTSGGLCLAGPRQHFGEIEWSSGGWFTVRSRGTRQLCTMALSNRISGAGSSLPSKLHRSMMYFNHGMVQKTFNTIITKGQRKSIDSQR